ncbi:hypothetical protein SeLEV6574_g02988 [Synchytrium endobioticum]|uniref:Uncharacterized protein n=1 Tax=Synchytrium endobioticum TaxID=286115 RepID=A0A507D6A3_9FUNG|nr:hypothetical protein SeLEV6574_g02988 [Synchytrium endobioticum]
MVQVCDRDYNAARNILYCFLYKRAFAERPRPFKCGPNRVGLTTTLNSSRRSDDLDQIRVPGPDTFFYLLTIDRQQKRVAVSTTNICYVNKRRCSGAFCFVAIPASLISKSISKRPRNLPPMTKKKLAVLYDTSHTCLYCTYRPATAAPALKLLHPYYC